MEVEKEQKCRHGMDVSMEVIGGLDAEGISNGCQVCYVFFFQEVNFDERSWE